MWDAEYSYFTLSLSYHIKIQTSRHHPSKTNNFILYTVPRLCRPVLTAKPHYFYNILEKAVDVVADSASVDVVDYCVNVVVFCLTLCGLADASLWDDSTP